MQKLNIRLVIIFGIGKICFHKICVVGEYAILIMLACINNKAIIQIELIIFVPKFAKDWANPY